MLYRHGKMSRYLVPAGFSDLAFPFCVSLRKSAAATQLELSDGYLGNTERVKLACHLEIADSSLGT